jgi:hypothetical protein
VSHRNKHSNPLRGTGLGDTCDVNCCSEQSGKNPTSKLHTATSVRGCFLLPNVRAEAARRGGAFWPGARQCCEAWRAPGQSAPPRRVASRARG